MARFEPQPSTAMRHLYKKSHYFNFNRAFDIGNLFAEMTIDYETKKHPYFKMKLDKIPNKNLQLMFIREYIRTFRETSENKKQNYYNLDEETIYNEANVFVLASHLYWIMWSLCQAFTSSISFDYIVSRDNYH